MPWNKKGITKGYKISWINIIITPYITIYKNLLKCIMNESKIGWNILKTIKMYIEYGKIKCPYRYKNVLRLSPPLCSTPLHFHPQHIHILSTIIYIKYPIISNRMVFKSP
jgi:hypothetical protein